MLCLKGLSDAATLHSPRIFQLTIHIACHSRAGYLFFQDFKEECEARDLPEELLDEYEEMDLDEEEEARAMDLLTRYNKILNTLTDNCMKAEQLCMCWDKLDQDTKELTSAMKW